jgi:pyridoxal phosphate enzyme (YggS family)
LPALTQIWPRLDHPNFGAAILSDNRMNEERLRRNVDTVYRQIAQAAERSGRRADAVRLVAVTKKSPVDWIRPLLACNAHDLGENYPQELWRKTEALADLSDSIRWHLIGHLQTNKVKKTLPLVKMIHSVDSLKLLVALNEAARALDNPPQVCLQVNTSGEETKHGWSADRILSEAEAIAGCRAIPIVGLMTMAALGTSAETARESFVRLRELRDQLSRNTALQLPELSMGMSNDFEAAVEEGATLVRIGSALFEGVEP